ncbi:hypothetical protein AAX22_06395 [Oenococcus oeni]|nr:hypothetical protein AAX22_06395 [Oenococcus oeni]
MPPYKYFSDRLLETAPEKNAFRVFFLPLLVSAYFENDKRSKRKSTKARQLSPKKNNPLE